MDSIFKICKKSNYGITVIGLEQDNNEYLTPENDLPSVREYKYEESFTINVIRGVNSDVEYTSTKTELVTHESNNIDSADVELNCDGLYEVSHIIVPNQLYIKNNPSILEEYSDLYYFDEDTDTYKNYSKGNKEVTLEEIIEVNPTAVDSLGHKNSIIRSDQNTISLELINKCLYNMIKKVLSAYCGKCINKVRGGEELIYNRDLIFMTKYVVEYLSKLGRPIEAQRILEAINQCGGICDFCTENTIKNNGCGCN